MREINLDTARRLWEIIGHGLVSGVGQPELGQMCVEAAVCYALDLPHGDDPRCVTQAVRGCKILLNDAPWSSDQARAKGLRRVAVAQLGSRGVVNNRKFAKRVAEKTIRIIVPVALRAAAKIHPSEHYRVKLNRAADFCAAESSRKSAILAGEISRMALLYAGAANSAAYAAAYAAYAATAAAAYAAYAATAAAAYAVVYAAAAVSAAAAFETRDEILQLGADICLEVLRELSSPGVALLDQLEAEMVA